MSGVPLATVGKLLGHKRARLNGEEMTWVELGGEHAVDGQGQRRGGRRR